MEILYLKSQLGKRLDQVVKQNTNLDQVVKQKCGTKWSHKMRDQVVTQNAGPSGQWKFKYKNLLNKLNIFGSITTLATICQSIII
jgi:hypothetical protein